MRPSRLILALAIMLPLAACNQDGLQTGGAGSGASWMHFAAHVPPDLPPPSAPWPPDREIPGRLRLPSGQDRAPAVVILHTSGGLDGRETPYATALLAAGIATLEVDMWTPRGITEATGVAMRPPAHRVLGDVYGALRFLANHPRIDPGRVGVMGFSFGATLAMLTATDTYGTAYGRDGPSFRAALTMYLVCWNFAPGGPNAGVLRGRFPRTPLLLLAAENDHYDEDGGESCRRIAAAGSAEASGRAAIHVYPGVSHGWDALQHASFHDPNAGRGRGGRVQMMSNRSVTQDAIRRTAEFFRTTL